jgi:hypothetical protein
VPPWMFRVAARHVDDGIRSIVRLGRDDAARSHRMLVACLCRADAIRVHVGFGHIVRDLLGSRTVIRDAANVGGARLSFTLGIRGWI